MTDSDTPQASEVQTEGTENVTFGAGCFWQIEVAYRELEGVVDVAVGYEGGHVDNPTYEQVCTGQTGHAEVVQVTFDPDGIAYEALVDKFWQVHDPTQMNRQGPDVGTQYRSAIFTHSPEQERVAVESKARAQESLKKEIVTSIEPATGFWRAEEYHQCYIQKRQEGGVMGRMRSALGA
jgi:peptide-methionine (S)-S-oxide reductase